MIMKARLSSQAFGLCFSLQKVERDDYLWSVLFDCVSDKYKQLSVVNINVVVARVGKRRRDTVLIAFNQAFK